MGGDIALILAFSTHLGMAGDYNEVHPAIQYQKDWFIAGAYLNSMDRVSVYAGAKLERGDWWAEVGAVSGYTDSLAPLLRAGYDFNETVAVFVAPAFEHKYMSDPAATEGYDLGAVLGVQFSF